MKFYHNIFNQYQIYFLKIKLKLICNVKSNILILIFKLLKNLKINSTINFCFKITKIYLCKKIMQNFS